MEQTLITGLLLSLIGGLGWLTCHHTRFATKILLAVLVCALMVHLSITAYCLGWNDDRTFVILTLNTLKTKNAEKIKHLLTQPISNSSDKLFSFYEFGYETLLLLEVALALLLLFALAFQKYTKTTLARESLPEHRVKSE